MTTPVGSNPPPQIEFSPANGVQGVEDKEPSCSEDDLNSAITANLYRQVRDAARELIDQLSDDNYWDAKMDSLEDRGEFIEQKNLFEHLQKLGIIANQAGVLDQLCD